MMLLLIPCPPQISTVGPGVGNTEQWSAWWYQTPAQGDGHTDSGGWPCLGIWYRECVGRGPMEGRGQWAVGS